MVGPELRWPITRSEIQGKKYVSDMPEVRGLLCKNRALNRTNEMTARERGFLVISYVPDHVGEKYALLHRQL